MLDKEREIAHLSPDQIRVAFLIATGWRLVTHEGPEDEWPYYEGWKYWVDSSGHIRSSATPSEETAYSYVTEGELDLQGVLEKLPTHKDWVIANKPGYGLMVRIKPAEAFWACDTLEELPLTVCKAYLDWKRYESDPPHD